ncbi:VWA domain-containing protein [Enemella evansiae]|uniref:VWA domain-containing protein n=1 Tax=Enemella evansiae TaxID=2016499 RepID=UPI000B96C6BC|nr:vWA domain-containing protein [Enemella evansiae]OYN93389.1 VWA domain-containing protein [Enemella evansiae]
MAGWLKKKFDSVGVTEYPAGAHLETLQHLFGGGSVVLALDVSGSMAAHDAGPKRDTQRLVMAVEGCQRFIQEAVEAHYSVGAILWHHDVDAYSHIDQSPSPALRLLGRATPSGGTDAVPFLMRAHEMLLKQSAGDLVVAVFGDGDLGSPEAAKRQAELLVADNIRIITCGLGDSSAETLAAISTENEPPRTASDDTIADSIAGMISGLRKR